jgi:hypothetical protein
MLRVRQRIERLEEEILPLPDPGPPEVLTLEFVDSQMKVVETREFPLGQVRPSNRRRWRAGRGPGKGGW